MEIDYEELAKNVYKSLNKIRTQPFSFIPELKLWKSKFRKERLYLLNENPLETFEGVKGVEEAISFLRIQKPVKELNYREELFKAAKDHAVDIGKNGLIGHEGSNGNLLADRIEKYCEWDDLCAENLDFGFKNADNIILNMLIDDGSPERNQRANLFSETFNYIGIGCSGHTKYNHCSVIVFAKALRDLGQKPNIAINFMQEYIQRTFYKRAIVNRFQENDPDAPDDTVSVKITKSHKVINGIEKKITKKIYKLKDQSLHIMEIEDN